MTGEQKTLDDIPIKREKDLSGPWPWYVLLALGFALSGFFSWLFVSWAIYQRGRKSAGLLALGANLAILVAFNYILLKMTFVWWLLTILVCIFNLLWAFAAWLFQRKTIGAAPARYRLAEWKLWIAPIVIGIVIGLCWGTATSIAFAFQDRMEMRESIDTLDREIVLWDFFKYSHFGIPFGLLLGFWWAGKGRRFNAGSVITYFGGMFVAVILWTLLEFLLMFLIRKGYMSGIVSVDMSNMVMIPPWISGYRKVVLGFAGFSTFILLFVPLLFDSVSRIRDFGKRALLLPLAFICTLFAYHFGQNIYVFQDHILYETDSPNDDARASANEWVDLILKRYPNHLKWPRMAEDLARFYYSEGKYGKAGALYREIADRFSDSNQWHWRVKRARSILNDPDFGKAPSGFKLEIPLVDYEEYITRNWMALLSVMRFWNGPEVSESKVKIKLKAISQSEDKIQLSSLTDMADLDEAVRSLGYEALILRSDLAGAKSLISSGFPIIHCEHSCFDLVFGFDENRSVTCAYSYAKLSGRLKEEARKEAKEILTIAEKEDDSGEIKRRLIRIARETYCEMSQDDWRSALLGYTAPFMALVFPKERSDDIAEVLNTPFEDLRKESDAFLASYIGLSYLNSADPVRSLEWAKIASRKTSDPMPLYVAFLAQQKWEARNKKIRSAIPLQDRFPELAEIFTFFNEPENVDLVERGRLRYFTDLDADLVPWFIHHTYIQQLDKSNPDDLDLIIRIERKRLALDPDHWGIWSFLTDMYERAQDIPGMAEALEGLVSAKPRKFEAKLRLVYCYVLLEQYEKAKFVLEEIDTRQIKFNADYPFCLGAIAEYESDFDEALEQYEKAADMRRYKPIYFLRYGKLLLRKGRNDEARKALEWAAKIDGGEEIRKEAESLLAKELSN